MNLMHMSFAVMTSVMANAYAADATQQRLAAVAVRSDARFVIDCRDQTAPSLRAVANVLQTNNSSRLYSERAHAMHFAHRECMRGALSVTFVRDDAAIDAALAMIDVH